MAALKTIHWVSASHWDREWHKTFEGFRCQLVEMVDRAIECVEKVPGYGWFLLDGQSIILRDYLEARPEMRETIERLLRSEKMFAGPFYVLQDEMVEDGELFVRNLQKGIALAKLHGSRRFVGYSPDSFGHCAQLPQILKLAGVDSVVFSRAFVGKQQNNLWKAPDGSEVFFVWMPLGNGGGSHKDCLDNGRHIPEDRKEALALFEKSLEKLKPYFSNGTALVVDGGDHLWADPAAVRLAEDFNAKHLSGPRFQISSMPDAVKELANSGSPDRVEGEIRMSGRDINGWLLPGTCSTRMPLKYGLSVLTRRLLALEKLYTLLPYSPTTQRAFDRAWDGLLQNIAHDSICGCHIDAVYIENLSRLNSVQSILAHLHEKGLRSFQKCQATTGRECKALFYDPAPDASRFKPFVLECPYEVIADPERVGLESPFAEWILSDVERYYSNHSHLVTYRIRGLYRNTAGKHVFSAQIVSAKRRSHATKHAKIHKHSRYEIKFRDDGTLWMRDLERQRTLGPLMLFVDGGDAGDTYNYSPPLEDSMVVSSERTQKVRVHELRPGFLKAEVDVVFAVPRSLSGDRKSRSPETVDLKIHYEVFTDLESGTLWISGAFKNSACDHRLRVAFKSPLSEDYSFSGAPFHIEKRPVKSECNTDGYSEKPVTDYPFVDFVSYGGLTVLSRSNGEYQITERGIEIALCRSVGWLGRPDLLYRKGQAGPFYEAPMAQLCDAVLDFGFIVVPSSGDMGEEYRRRELLMDAMPQVVHSHDRSPVSCSFLIEARGAVVSALRKTSDGEMEVRLFNPRAQKSEVHLGSKEGAFKWVQVDLHGDEVKRGFQFEDEAEIVVELEAFQIANFLLLERIIP